MPDDDAYDFVISIADGTLSEVSDIAAQLQQWICTLAEEWQPALKASAHE